MLQNLHLTISVREKVFSTMQLEFNRPILACDRIGRPIYLASPEIFLAELNQLQYSIRCL